MTLGNIAKRYAKALYLYAAECKVEERVYGQALTLCHAIEQVPDLMRALQNPVVEQPVKLDLLSQTVGGRMDEVLMRFVRLVFEQRRENCFPFILRSFIMLYRNEKNIHVGKLTTAVPMDSRVEESLRHKITEYVQGTVEFEMKVDEGIQGGFILQLGDKRMDASVKGQLRQIQAELMR